MAHDTYEYSGDEICDIPRGNSPDVITIACKASLVPDGIPVAVLVVMHGVAEQSGRYSNIVNYFVPRGYAIYSFDLRGHGKSEGKRSYVEHFSYYLDDLKTFCDKAVKRTKTRRSLWSGIVWELICVHT